MKFEFTAAVLAACLASQANAWWGTAHLLIANIAQTILEDEAPNSLQQALDELTTLANDDSSLVTENKYPFTECATFADDIKSEGFSYQDTWHYINQPLMLDGSDLDDSNFVMPDEDILSAVAVIEEWLLGVGDYEQSTYYQTIMDSLDDDEDDGRSFALRLLIHYVGDIHNPMHAVTGVSEHYDHGDNGGNYETLTDLTDCDATNLHAVWDSVIYEYCGYPTLPLSDSDYATLQSSAANITANYPVDTSNYLTGQFQMWAAEAYDIAETYVYPNVVVNEPLSAEYQTAAKPVANLQLARGGRRLAEIIKIIYPNDSTSFFLE